MHRSVVITTLLCLVAVSGCAVVPLKKKVGTRGAVPKEYEDSIQIGVTEREDVLLDLGEPAVVQGNDTVLMWKWKWGWDTYWFAIGGHTASSDVNRDRKDHTVAIEFDDFGRVKSVSHWWVSGCEEDRPSWSSFKHANRYCAFELKLPTAWHIVKDDRLFRLLNHEPSLDYPSSQRIGSGEAVVEAYGYLGAASAKGFFRSLFSRRSPVDSRRAEYPRKLEEGLFLAISEVQPDNNLGKANTAAVVNPLRPSVSDAEVKLIAEHSRKLKCGSFAIWTDHAVEIRSLYKRLSVRSLTYSFANDRVLFQLRSYCELPDQDSLRQKALENHKRVLEKVVDSFRILKS